MLLEEVSDDRWRRRRGLVRAGRDERGHRRAEVRRLERAALFLPLRLAFAALVEFAERVHRLLLPDRFYESPFLALDWIPYFTRWFSSARPLPMPK